MNLILNMWTELSYFLQHFCCMYKKWLPEFLQKTVDSNLSNNDKKKKKKKEKTDRQTDAPNAASDGFLAAILYKRRNCCPPRT